MKQSKPDLTFSVLESNAALKMAERFLTDEVNQPDDDACVTSTTALQQRRGLINRFQKLVMDIFCDDLFMETILETPDKDLDTATLETYAIYKEFITKFPHTEVIAMVPMNLAGTIGFITTFCPPIR